VFLVELSYFRARPDHVRALAARRAPLLRTLRRRYRGFRSAHLARVGSDEWIDVSLWETRQDAEVAAREVFELEEMADWRAQVHEFSVGPAPAQAA
jgi:heme-degrading monooxygenase HmoA